ncbi:MAG TPA: TIGR00266 family protein, partial [Pyrodictium sp.]|nr:TIGR00266 family protein [Pyrodictium sp.]
WKSFLFGGEGIVLEVQGPTKLLVQTRILPPLAQLIAKFLPKE